MGPMALLRAPGSAGVCSGGQAGHMESSGAQAEACPGPLDVAAVWAPPSAPCSWASLSELLCPLLSSE